MRPSRLAVVTGRATLPASVAAVTAGSLTLTGDDIASISITRGGADDYDALPHTVTIETVRELPLMTGEPLTVTIAGQRRFTGIVGGMTMHDRGDHRRRMTTLEGSTWGVRLDNLDPSVTIHDGTSLASILQHITADHVVIADARLWDWPTLGIGEASYASTMSKVTREAGVAVLTRRNGAAVALSHAARREQLDAHPYIVMSVPRSAVTAGIDWDQRAGYLGLPQAIEYTLPGGGIGRRSSWTSEDPDPVAHVIHDRHWWQIPSSSDLLNWVEVLEWRDRADLWRLPALTVELLPLLSSSSASRRALGVMLRDLEVGAPLALSVDWPHVTGLRGWHFATGITETITPTRWTLEITTAPSFEVVGFSGPPFSGATWDTALPTWDASTETWEEI